MRDSQLWTLCELFKSFYVLNETAETLGRGGVHYTTNPCKNTIINTQEAARINTEVLPAIFEEIYKILIPAQDNKKIDAKLLKIILSGDTDAVVDFMNEHRITTDDLKNIDGVTAHDFNIIHTIYWRRYHANKKTK